MSDAPGYTCPRFERCNASFCPGLGGHHIRGELVCYYLLEAVKPGGEARIRGVVGVELAEAIFASGRRLIVEPAPIRQQLQRASVTPSRMEQCRAKAPALIAARRARLARAG